MTRLTRPEAPNRPELLELVVGTKPTWVPPFIMAVVSNPDIFAALAPAVAPGLQQKLTGGQHFARTVPPIEIGYLRPGDGSYGAAIRSAHTGIDPELLGMSVSWNQLILAKIATANGRERLIPTLVAAAQVVAYDIGGDPDPVADPEAELKMMQHFSSPDAAGIIRPEQRAAFWEVLEHGPIRNLLSNPSDVAVLDGCQAFSPMLPGTLIAQYARS